MKISFFFITLFISYNSIAQVSANGGIFMAKEFSKEIASYRSKAFVITEVLGISKDPVKFEIDPLAAASSGELTSLVYRCDEKNKAGMIFGFFGDRWNSSGVRFNAFAFKNLPKKDALELFDKIEKTVDENAKYINQDDDVNNVYHYFDDIMLLIYKKGSTKIRVFWNDFDSEWDLTAFRRTKRRLQHKLD